MDGVYEAETAHQKADFLQDLLMTSLDYYLPQKTMKLTSDDQPWVTSQIKQLDRSRKREYCKNKKSEKWRKLDDKFKEKCGEAKASYSKDIVNDLKTSNAKDWYSKIKRMSSIDQSKNTDLIVESIADEPHDKQVELIADNFEQISKNYEPLNSCSFSPEIFEKSKSFSKLQSHEIYQTIR